MSWINLPKELRDRPQWCIAATAGMYSDKGKEPLSLKSDGTFYFASVTEPSTWLPFNVAANVAWKSGMSIGYVLSQDDPFTCIDFDIKDASSHPNEPHLHTTRADYDFFTDCMMRFDSYTERSLSGRGFHTWVRGKIQRGTRNRGIEIYSQERFIISTGVVTNLRPIEDRTVMIQAFAEHIRPRGVADDLVLEEVEEEADDWYILNTAISAANSDKFWQLYKEGRWEGEYPSQSEADLALMSMFTFYSPSNAQCRRLFRDSALGQRDKATRDDKYLNYTLRTIRSRERREHSVDIAEVAKSAEFAAKMEQQRLADQEVERIQGKTNPVSIQPLHIPGQEHPEVIPSVTAAMAMAGPVAEDVVKAGEEGIPWPPGFAGAVAQFIYESAPRPVKEVGIVAAIGLLAGICGKAWHVPQSGLNMYVVLVARSAVGKEAMHSGVSAIMKAVTAENPLFQQFINFSDFASGPALTKACAMAQSFVNVCGEWGEKMKRIANAEDGRDPAMATLRRVMTDLYQKSGPQSVVGGIQYSQTDNNIQSVSGVAYSMIGESTPKTFYEALTPTMMENGFLSRFLIIEYTGDRPAANPNQVLIPHRGIVQHFSQIAHAANRVPLSNEPSRQVYSTDTATTILAAFEKECDQHINGTKNESFRQMWNRAALKALRLAALLAVGDNPVVTYIHDHHIRWAIDVVRRDIGIMERRLIAGDVGLNDNTREKKLFSCIRWYLEKDLPPTYKDFQNLKNNNIVARRYLQQKTGASSAFTKFRGGTTRALDATLDSAILNGFLAEVPKDKAVSDYKFHGKCYRILGLPADTNNEEED